MLEVGNFLNLFKSVTDNVQGEKYITIMQVWPSLTKIHKHVYETAPCGDLVQSMISRGKEYIQKNIDIFTPSIEHKAAIFLHPLLKSLHFASSNDRKEIYEYVKREIIDRNENDIFEQVDSPLIVATTSKSGVFDDFLMEVRPEDTGNITTSEVVDYTNLKVRTVNFIFMYYVINLGRSFIIRYSFPPSR